MKEKIIQQGAEAVIILKKDLVLKRRVKKGYRLEILDERIRKRRTKSEARILERVVRIISVPKVLRVREKEKEIDMEFIDGLKLSESLDGLKNWKKVCFKIGKNIAKLHDENIIHGDLTTSNMILKGEEVYFIDFGLGYLNGKFEDKAVDLHLIKQALEAKHFGKWEEYWKEIRRGYKVSKNVSVVLERLEKVEKRGRYKGSC